jgi:hypothetical protein
MRIPKLLAALLTSCVLAALTPLGTAQAAAGPAIDNTSLTNGGKPCSATTPPVVLGYFGPLLEAAGSDDAYSPGFDYTFSIWPLTDPAAVRSVSVHGYSSGQLVHAQLPDDVLVDGHSYAWRVQLRTSNGTSPWSQACTFSYDNTSPATPAVSSANYPRFGEGQSPVGEFAQFTFDSGGDPDTVGFYYAWTQDLPSYACSFGGPLGQLVCPDIFADSNTVRVASPGGSASVTLPPVSDGPQTLSVVAMDVAGNRSPAVQYQTFVPWSGPTVSVAGGRPICGGSGSARVVFAPNPGLTTGVSSYTYTVDGNPAVTVPAGANGTAKVWMKDVRESAWLQVTSLSTNGFRSGQGYLFLDVNPQVSVYSSGYPNSGQPVGGVGVLGQFRFSPPYTDGSAPTSFSYRFPDGPVKTVPADEFSGDASVQWAPVHAGQQTMTVQAMNADGSPASCTTSYTFTVAR